MAYTLWGAANSLYTGKARSYLIKKGLPFRERYPSDPEFGNRILPAVGQFVVPVLESDNGEIVQDSGDIIDFLEKSPCRTIAQSSNAGAAVRVADF
ncbi:MAG: glutathione S-transferase N-terminal domain-containing protein [Sphingomonadales bacterium]|nr:glutathione S-transferase N-terminal domain-containing protein [Sphingomonadales bacterium]